MLQVVAPIDTYDGQTSMKDALVISLALSENSIREHTRQLAKVA